MSDEKKEMQITAPPMVHLVLAGVDATLKYLSDPANKDAVGPEKVFAAFAGGVRAVMPKVGYGLHALSPKEERNLMAIQAATKQIEEAGKKDELELKLVVVPKRVEGGLVGADGKPLTKDSGKLIVAK